jgi:hypothetical protein
LKAKAISQKSSVHELLKSAYPNRYDGKVFSSNSYYMGLVGPFLLFAFEKTEEMWTFSLFQSRQNPSMNFDYGFYPSQRFIEQNHQTIFDFISFTPQSEIMTLVSRLFSQGYKYQDVAYQLEELEDSIYKDFTLKANMYSIVAALLKEKLAELSA